MNTDHHQLPLVSTAVLTSSNFWSVNKCLMSLCFDFHRLPTDFQRLPKCPTHILFCFLRFPNSLLSATMVYDLWSMINFFFFFQDFTKYHGRVRFLWWFSFRVKPLWSLISPMLCFPYYLTYFWSKSLSYWPWRPSTFHVLFCFLYKLIIITCCLIGLICLSSSPPNTFADAPTRPICSN